MDELQKRPSGSTPDLSSSSMTYMPKSKGAPAEDNDFAIDKKSEKKTVADLPDKLGAAEAEKQEGIKVMVNGKPKQTPSPKPQPKHDDGSLAVRASHVAPVTDSLHAGGSMAHPEDIPNHSAKARGGSNKGLIIVIVLLLLASLGLGYIAYASNVRVTKLNADLKQANADKEALQTKDTTTDESPMTPAIVGDSVGKRSIPEVGLTYKLTSNTNKVTYAYSEVQESGGTVRSVLSFSTTTLIAAERKVLKNGAAPACLASDKALGSITSYKSTDTVPSGMGSGKFSDFKVDDKTSFKLGETYYVYSAPQATCSSDKTVQSVETSDKAIVSELLTSLATQ